MMKTKFFILGILYVFLIETTFAQTEKGGFLIGGELLINKTTDIYQSSSPDQIVTTFNCNLSPAISYFVTKNFAIGISTPFSYGKSSYKDNNNNTRSFQSKAYSIGPIFRYYIPIKSVAFFTEASNTYEWKKDIRSLPNYRDGKKQNLIFKWGIGLTYFLNNNIGIEGLVFYQFKSDWTKNYYKSSSDHYQDQGSINFRIGVQVYLSKKSKEEKRG